MNTLIIPYKFTPLLTQLIAWQL